jgi:hypothetical protein
MQMANNYTHCGAAMHAPSDRQTRLINVAVFNMQGCPDPYSEYLVTFCMASMAFRWGDMLPVVFRMASLCCAGATSIMRRLYLGK